MQSENFMRPNNLFVRCYAERKGSQWEAFCVDFSLGAQGSSLAEAKTKLEAQIREYVYDAMTGVDREHGEYLLYRRAPLRFRLRYLFIRIQREVVKLASKFVHLQREARRSREGSHVPFRESLPLVLADAHC